jgi:threonine dehydratase
VSELAPATALSFDAGSPISTATANTFLDGVACRTPDPDAIDIIVKGAARIVQVSEDLGAEAVRLLYRTTHNVPEPAGAAALAGLLVERDLQQGKRVAVIQTGGNMDAGILTTILRGSTPHV